MQNQETSNPVPNSIFTSKLKIQADPFGSQSTNDESPQRLQLPSKRKSLETEIRESEDQLVRKFQALENNETEQKALIEREIQMWAKHIQASSRDPLTQNERIDRLVSCFFLEPKILSFASDNLTFVQIYFGYIKQVNVRCQKSLMDLARTYKLGFSQKQGRYIIEIAEFYWKKVHDYRMADKVFRDGVANCGCSINEQCCAKLKERFMQFGVEVGQKLPINERVRVQTKTQSDSKLLAKMTERNQRQSFTDNQVLCGGCYIYVDPELREKTIPEPTQQVEKFYKSFSAAAQPQQLQVLNEIERKRKKEFDREEKNKDSFLKSKAHLNLSAFNPFKRCEEQSQQRSQRQARKKPENEVKRKIQLIKDQNKARTNTMKESHHKKSDLSVISEVESQLSDRTPVINLPIQLLNSTSQKGNHCTPANKGNPFELSFSDISPIMSRVR